MAEDTVSAPVSNRFDRMEIAGAFGDLGTLVPFVVAYIGVLKMDPFGVLFAFGFAMVICGFVYRTPIPVQPMKAAGAIATTQAAQTLVLTPAMVWGASLATGIVWLLLGLTGTARYVASLINRPVRRRSPPIGIRCGCCDLRSSRVPDAACVVASFIRRSIKELEEWPHSGR